MTEWYEPHIIAVQPGHLGGSWRPWAGASLTIDEAKKGERSGTHIMCQKRLEDQTLLLAWRRKEPVKTTTSAARAGRVR